MARYTGPKHRLARREGINILDKKSASLERRLNVPPGQHGPKGNRKKPTEYGIQMREKQKVKRMYGVLEKQFSNYFEKAAKKSGETGTTMLSLLERRLDNVVYRLGLARSRNLARQLVSHGHVYINGKRVTIPSYQVQKDEVITLSAKALNIPVVKSALEANDVSSMPSWLTRKGPVGNVKDLPAKEDLAKLNIAEQLIVEYYSR